MSADKADSLAGACVSDEFRRAFGSGGCSHVACACGRDNGEPDGDDAVMVLDVGALVADGCECGAGPKYENWVWTHRSQLADYLLERGEREAAEAQRLAASLTALSRLGGER